MYPAALINRSSNNSLLHHQPVEINRILREQNGSSQANHTERKSRARTVNSIATRSNHQEFSSSRQANNEVILAKRAVPLINSRPSGTLHDRIQRERRAHTMAPLARISGPSSTPKANLFATITAPDQSNRLTSDIERPNDDTPIIVKVRYDPRTGVLPSEDAVRKAIRHQISDRNRKKDPIIVDFSKPNKQTKLLKPIPHRVSLQPSSTFPSVSRPPQSFQRYLKNPPAQAPKPTVNRQIWSISSSRAKGFNNTKPIQQGMASPQSAGSEVFRPPPLKDIPELSRENLLSMLNQIPDLQGRQFNIEYAPPSAPDGYPIPLHLDSTNNAYPEPVVIDTLPSNVIQHVKSSNNPALTAALEATIQQEQKQLQSHPPTVIHHAAQQHQQVQQSRSPSSEDSDSSTESSSSSSSSEETDSEEFEQPKNSLPFVGPMPPKFFSHS